MIFATFKYLGCGDYLEKIGDSNGQKFLGTVSLSSQQTYVSCRRVCQAKYPDFEFYHKFINYQSCDCFKMEVGFKIKTSDHGAYTFGYAATCSMIIKIYNHILKRNIFLNVAISQ